MKNGEPAKIRTRRLPAAQHGLVGFYFTFKLTVAVPFELLMPSKFTVALGRKVKPVRLGAVIPITTLKVMVGLVVFGPPSAAMLQVITLVLPRPGTGALHVAALDPVLGVGFTELIVRPLSTVMVNSTLLATVPVLSLAEKVRVPD
jgi:hypothetical protein